MMANHEMLDKTMDFIREHPEKLDMGVWVRVDDGADECGTTACFAGWTAILNGAEPVFDSEYVLVDGIVHTPRRVAAHILELNEREENALFFCNKEDLEDTVNLIKRGHYQDDHFCGDECADLLDSIDSLD